MQNGQINTWNLKKKVLCLFSFSIHFKNHQLIIRYYILFLIDIKESYILPFKIWSQ